ncbi:MAG: HEAT repeat domain-containing protein [Elusimicrobiota bacterium]|nr:HEAT repeat domain-containing protein [Elusimicrobiota bacterium]
MRIAIKLSPLLALAFLANCGEVTVRTDIPSAYDAPAPGTSPLAPGETRLDPAISNALIKLAEDRRSLKRDLTGIEGTPIADILTVGSPIGYALRNRFLNVGIPLGEAFASSTDPAFRGQLLELSRWDRDGESRAAALIALARTHDGKYLQVFNEALIHLDPAVRFGALEALVVFEHPRQAMPLLAAASERDSEPLLRVYAAAGLARMGDDAGLHRVRSFLDNPSWVVKSLAAKYLGELGTAEDYDLLLRRIDGEVGNDFVVAEFCVSALKLWPKKKATEANAPAAATAPAPATTSLSLASFSLEPLTVTAPRVRQQELINPRINAHLLRLLQQRMDARPDTLASGDASLFNLARLSTLTGYSLKTRYTELGFLLTEGLAGTKDYQLQRELENAARLAKNVQTRAAALVALAYAKDMRYLNLFQGALNDHSVTVRFAALESLLTLGDQSVQLQLGGAARNDQSLAVQIYAAAGMWRKGDSFGKEILLRFLDHTDWFARAMAVYYLGEMGGGYEYRRMAQYLDRETDPSTKAELATALMKLHPKKDEN